MLGEKCRKILFRHLRQRRSLLRDKGRRSTGAGEILLLLHAIILNRVIVQNLIPKIIRSRDAGHLQNVFPGRTVSAAKHIGKRIDGKRIDRILELFP